MNIKRAEFSEEEKAEIASAQRGTYPEHVHKRLLALKYKALGGMRSDETGKLIGLHATSINRIVSRYKQEGMQAITGKRHNHGNRYMTREEEETFLMDFQTRSGAGHIIEIRDIHLAYEQAVSHPVTRSMIYCLLHRHGWRKVMPRSRHEKKASEEEIQAYKKNHRKDKNPEKGPAKALGDVPGRGWVWKNQ